MPFITPLLLASTLLSDAATSPAVVGEWRYGSVRGVTYWDSSSGHYLGDGGGQSDTYIFAKDGTFKEYVYMKNSPMAGWTTQIFTRYEGKYAVEGDKIKLTVVKGDYKVSDNRVQRQNYDRPMTDEEVKKAAKSYRFTLDTDNGKPVLLIHLTKKEKITYRWVEKQKQG
ncbi:hypothetical protein EON81_25095 [bacterium]|nr:MAG: hypothetical protein EON81_25095 [bacterium]